MLHFPFLAHEKKEKKIKKSEMKFTWLAGTFTALVVLGIGNFTIHFYAPQINGDYVCEKCDFVNATRIANAALVTWQSPSTKMIRTEVIMRASLDRSGLGGNGSGTGCCERQDFRSVECVYHSGHAEETFTIVFQCTYNTQPIYLLWNISVGMLVFFFFAGWYATIVH